MQDYGMHLLCIASSLRACAMPVCESRNMETLPRVSETGQAIAL